MNIAILYPGNIVYSSMTLSAVPYTGHLVSHMQRLCARTHNMPSHNERWRSIVSVAAGVASVLHPLNGGTW